MREALWKIISDILDYREQDNDKRYEQIMVKLLDDLMTIYSDIYLGV